MVGPNDPYGEPDIFAQLFGNDGAPVGGEFVVNTDPSHPFDPLEDPQVFSSVTELSNGGFVISWNSEVFGSFDQGVFGQIYDASGSIMDQ